MKIIWTLICSIVCITLLSAQGGISGTVSSQDGQPLAYATIFVKETGSGTATNEKGRYQIQLAPGDYTLVFQILGYQTATRPISIGSRFEQLNISLTEQALQLEEVDVYSGREDPAYTVMRKAIAKASYHRQQLDAYSARVYIKGTGRLKKAPALLRGMLEDEGIDSSFAFTSESVSEVSYERPGKFNERVISIYTSGDAAESSPNGYINGSFYEPKIGESVSPLSTRAFAYYRFAYEGFFLDRGYGVNKIKVIPRTAGDRVFEGFIYIVEDLWSIYSLSLSSINQGFTFDIEQVYAPVEEKVWMPVSHVFDVEGSLLGFTVEYKYLATVSDYEVQLNPDLEADFVVIDEKVEEEKAEELQAERPEKTEMEERLETGGELTRKEMRKLMREYAKEERKQKQEPEVVEERNFTIDSMAYKRDSIYWQQIRPVPLTTLEQRGYKLRDSLAQVEAEEAAADSLDGGRDLDGFGAIGHIIGGKTFRLGENSTFAYDGVWDKTYFNPVESFNMHTNFIFTHQPKDNRFTAVATPRYAFERQRLSGKGALAYTFGNPAYPNETSLDGGRYIYQYNNENPISFLFSSYVNLFRDINYIRIYEKDFLQLRHRQYLKENWMLELGGEWANRYRLENNTTQVWFNKEDQAYASNYPVSRELGPQGIPDEERAFVLSAAIEARPWQKYRIYNGVREAIDGTSPTLRLSYRQGIAGVEGSQTDYRYLEGSVTHRLDIGVRGTLDFKVQAGLFLEDDYVGFADYRHFMGNELSIVAADPVASYRLLPYYNFSTRDRFASVFVHHQFRKLMLTQIPAVWMLGLKENIFVNTLSTPDSGNYLEAGYSIDNIFRIFRVELAFSFDDGGYRDWGVLIGVASALGGGSFEIN